MAGAEPIEPPTSGYTGVHVGPWTISPSLYVGFAFNDNLYETTSNKVGDAAWRTTPTLLVTNNSGINNLSLYATLDSYVYLRHANDNTFNGRVGFADDWEIKRDLVLKLAGDASRQTDTQDSGQTLGGVTVLPLRFWQYEASASLLKSFNRLFVSVGGNFVNQTYDSAAQTDGATLPEAARDSDASTLSTRLGYYLGPDIYAYTEVDANNQAFYNYNTYGSHGYSVVGGVGANRLSLFKGELYVGYQEQYYNPSLGGAQGGAAFGGKISWLPTEFLTFSATLGTALTTTVASSLTPTTASATRNTAATLAASYALAQAWSATAHVNYTNVVYLGSSRVDDDMAAGLTLSRRIWENLDATADYQLARVASNVVNGSYTQNIVSLGLTYKY